MNAIRYTADFALARHAAAFAARISEDGWSATNVARKGRTVTWDGPDDRQYFLDLLETVGYYGSAPTGRKAKLNGQPAPASW